MFCHPEEHAFNLIKLNYEVDERKYGCYNKFRCGAVV